MPYRYSLAILDADGSSREHVSLDPDWGPALACARLQGIREGRLRPLMAGAGAVEPIWDDVRGAPFVVAFRAVVPADDGGGEVGCDIPRTYVRDLVQQAAVTLVERGVLQPGTQHRFAVTATPAPIVVPPDGAAAFAIEDDPRPLRLVGASLATFRTRAVAAEPVDPPGALPTFVPRRILDETIAAAQATGGEIETGGMLLGVLHRDTDAGGSGAPELFLEVTEQLPAEHTRAESTRLTFTPETWGAVHATLALRSDAPLLVGWWHYHPDFCAIRRCPPERRVGCTATSAFFSAEDVRLMTVCFPAAHQVALLLSASTANGITGSMYGWSQGMVAPRGFHVLDSPPTKGA